MSSTAWYELVGYVSEGLPNCDEPHGPPLQRERTSCAAASWLKIQREAVSSAENTLSMMKPSMWVEKTPVPVALPRPLMPLQYMREGGVLHKNSEGLQSVTQKQ